MHEGDKAMSTKKFNGVIKLDIRDSKAD